MKRIVLSFLAVMFSIIIMAQTPQKFNYQAVVRDGSGAVVAEKVVVVNVSILKGDADGVVAFKESHTVKTTAQGLISFAIGSVNSMDVVDWANDIYFVKTEIDIDVDGKNDVGTVQQLLSVPYAIHAKTAEYVSNVPDYTETDPSFTSWDKSSGIVIKEEQISDFGSYLKEESDPIYKNSVAARITTQDTIKWNRAADSIVFPFQLTQLNKVLAELSAKNNELNDKIAYLDSLSAALLHRSPDYCDIDYSQGVLSGEFSVSETKKVRFSQGNLQYQASTKTWRFAENQYDFVGIGQNTDASTYNYIQGRVEGSDNRLISKTYDGWIDLFGWGTSGWINAPYSLSEGVGNSVSLVGPYENADWGVYNAISNGGDAKGIWRTLTSSEMGYLLSDKRGPGKYGVAQVGSVCGLILLPDDFEIPESIIFVPGVASESGVAYYKTKNLYTIEEWKLLEHNGAVFLPSAGRRDSSDVSFVGSVGRYWSSSYGGSTSYSCAVWLSFGSGSIETYGMKSTHSSHVTYGCSVRLVRDVE